MRHVTVSMLSALVLTALTGLYAGCSSSGGSDSPEGPGETCVERCEAIAQQCGNNPGQCPTICQTATEQELSCMETTNCVLFTAWLLSAAMPVTFTKDQWSMWMVSASDTSAVPQVPGYGPRVIMEWGAGSPAPGEGPWLVQWFTNTGGHSIIVLADDPDTGKILTLEANDSIDGAGWNQIGPLRDVPHPGSNWAEKVTQTWGNRVYSKRAVHIVGLNITGVQEWLESA